MLQQISVACLELKINSLNIVGVGSYFRIVTGTAERELSELTESVVLSAMNRDNNNMAIICVLNIRIS